MTNLVLEPMTRTLGLGRQAVATASRLAAPVTAPLARPLAAVAGSARAALRHAPALAVGAVEQVSSRLPHVVTEQLPARQGVVDALAARIADLEATAAAPVTTPRAKTKTTRAR